MQDKQTELLFKVLNILQDKSVLRHFVIAGSWCIYFYRFYFHKRSPIASLRTRDVDFLIPNPKSLNTRVDLPELLRSLGFTVDYRGEQGFMRLVHPELFIEFLVPEKGRGIDKAFSLPHLGLNAQALRFLDILYLKTVTLEIKGLKINLPDPACFLLQKIIILERRPEKDKKEKELEQIERTFDLIKKENKVGDLKSIFLKLHPKWRSRLINNLSKLDKKEIIDIFQ